MNKDEKRELELFQAVNATKNFHELADVIRTAGDETGLLRDRNGNMRSVIDLAAYCEGLDDSSHVDSDTLPFKYGIFAQATSMTFH